MHPQVASRGMLKSRTPDSTTLFVRDSRGENIHE